jgi:hypothetical protein
VCGHLNLSVADILDLNDITEVSDTAVNLDLVLKELLEGGDVKDLVACGLRSVDDELCVSSAPILLHITSTHFPRHGGGFSRGEKETYLLGDLGLLALGGFLQIDDLSLLYHAATSQEAGQQQSNFMYVLLMVPLCIRRWSQRGVILRRLSIEMG